MAVIPTALLSLGLVVKITVSFPRTIGQNMKGKELVIRPNYVKVIRGVLDLTQVQLAELMDVSAKTVWTWENEGAPLLVGKALFGEVSMQGKLIELSEKLPSFRNIVSDS